MHLYLYLCVNTADTNGPERQAQHAAARLRTQQLCDIATLAWDAKLEGLVREACPLALAVEWSGEVDPEVVRWQTEVTNPASPYYIHVGSSHWLDQGVSCKRARTPHGVSKLDTMLQTVSQVVRVLGVTMKVEHVV